MVIYFRPVRLLRPINTYINDSIYKFGDAEALVDFVLAALPGKHLIELEVALAGRRGARLAPALGSLAPAWVDPIKVKQR